MAGYNKRGGVERAIACKDTHMQTHASRLILRLGRSQGADHKIMRHLKREWAWQGSARKFILALSEAPAFPRKVTTAQLSAVVTIVHEISHVHSCWFRLSQQSAFLFERIFSLLFRIPSALFAETLYSMYQ